MVKKFLDHTTPLHELMRLRDFFLIVQPPLLLLRRGVPGTRTPSWFALKSHSQFGHMCCFGEAQSFKDSLRKIRVSLQAVPVLLLDIHIRVV